jgi:hypothetical protein
MMNINSGQSQFSAQNALQKLMGQMMPQPPQMPAMPVQNIQGMMGGMAKMSPGWSYNKARRFGAGNKLALLKSYAGVSSLKSGFDPRTLRKF